MTFLKFITDKHGRKQDDFNRSCLNCSKDHCKLRPNPLLIKFLHHLILIQCLPISSMKNIATRLDVFKKYLTVKIPLEYSFHII